MVTVSYYEGNSQTRTQNSICKKATKQYSLSPSLHPYSIELSKYVYSHRTLPPINLILYYITFILIVNRIFYMLKHISSAFSPTWVLAMITLSYLHNY